MPDDSELMEELATVRAHSQEWGRDWDTDMVGRIESVRFVDAEGDIDSLRHDLARARRRAEQESSRDSWQTGVAELVSAVTEQADKLDDGDGVLVVVELPDGSRFGHLFSVPETTDGLFYRFCRGLDVQPSASEPMVDDVIVGKTVPVRRWNGRWRVLVGRVKK